MCDEAIVLYNFVQLVGVITFEFGVVSVCHESIEKALDSVNSKVARLGSLVEAEGRAFVNADASVRK